MRHRDVSRPTYSSLKGINRVVEEITRQIPTELTWITDPFGLAQTKVKNIDNRSKRYPAILIDSEYVSMLPDDWFDGILWAFAHDPSETIEEQTRRFKQKVSFYFWYNQVKIYSTIGYNNQDVLITEAIVAIKKCEVNKKLIEIHRDPPSIFEGFDLDTVKDQHLSHPFGGFRLTYELVYNDVC